MRSSGVFAMSPSFYGAAKGAFHQGADVLERFPPTYAPPEEVFDEYLSNKSMSPSRHRSTLASSSGLMEMHYNTMRRKRNEREEQPTYTNLPSMDRAFKATAGYSGLIPGKISNNIIGCSSQVCNQLAYETRGKFMPPPMSGFEFTLGVKSAVKSPVRSRSTSSLQNTANASDGFAM